VVLFRQDSRRGQRVAACSPLAKRDGVTIDLPLTEAKSLLRRGLENENSPVHILPHDPTADLIALEKLADRLDCFSPIIGLETDTDQPDCLLMDITGLGSLFGGEPKIALGLQQHCGDLGYVTRVAIANTIGMAWGMVKFGGRKAEVGREEEFRPSNSDLPIESLRLSDWIVETLHQLGVDRIEQLVDLPRRDLKARFGDEIHWRMDQMTGAVAEPIVARHPPPEFFAQQLLDYPTSHRETIEIVMQRLIESICGQLASAQQGALQWTIGLYCQHALPLKFCVSLFQPTATADHVIPLVRIQLEQILQPQTARSKKSRLKKKRPNTLIKSPDGQPLEINEITISVTSCVLLADRQRQLFDENPRLDRQALAHLINRLSGRLGRHHVVYPTLNSGAQPEHAFQFRPLVNPHRRTPRRIDNTKARPASHVMARPLRMFNPPIPVGSLQVAGGSSIQLLTGTDLRPTAWWGPERIETGWWRGRTASRDYWRVETETNQQFWIYRDLRSQQWFLHGEF
jgi:protein ImuB